jgi:uncharacterized cofD-like protein
VSGARVVAIGGGHGLAVTLRAAREYAEEITAIVSVADDGGSTGRLRRDYQVPAPGDLRKCLVALAGDDAGVWRDAFEHRFEAGDLGGHALGNLILVGLTESIGDFGRALEESGRLLHAVGRVLPATTEPVVLKATISGREVEGQTAVQSALGRIARVGLVPEDAPTSPEAAAAIGGADQVLLAPGSLYTSLLPVLCVHGVRRALAGTRAGVVQIGNLVPQIPETAGMDGTDHVQAVLDHGARVDRLLAPEEGRLAVDPARLEALGVALTRAPLARPDAQAHDPARLAVALAALL